MDRRKLKFRGGLHKNLIGSQLSSGSGLSGSSLDVRSVSEEVLSHKSNAEQDILLRSSRPSNDGPLSNSAKLLLLHKTKSPTKETLAEKNKSSKDDKLGRHDSPNKENVTRKSKLLLERTTTQKSHPSKDDTLSRKGKSVNEELSTQKSKAKGTSSRKRRSESEEVPTEKNKSSKDETLSGKRRSGIEETSPSKSPPHDETLLRSRKSGGELSTKKTKSSINETLSRKRKSSVEEASSRKRKSLNFPSSRDESDSDFGLPLAESTVVNKKQDESTIAGGTLPQSSQKITSINKSIISQKNVNAKSVRNNNPKCKFVDFLFESGITLNTDGPHLLNKDLIIVQRKMKELLDNGQYQKAEIISALEKYIENDQNLENALNDIEISVNSEVSHVLYSSSLVKILLQVPELHPEIYSTLLSKLNESVLIADSIETVPWAPSLLQQFRFLDVLTTSDILTNNLEELLESCPPWFQHELILFLPDIVTDKQHQTIAEILNKLLEENSDLTHIVLNCMSNLNLGKEYLDEYREKVINLLKTNLKMEAIPAIIKFVLEDCTNIDIFKKTLTVLRSIDIQPLVGENLVDCYKNQLDVINTLKMNMLLSKDTVNATIGVIKDINKDPKPLDIILLLLIFSTTEKKRKNIESIFKQHIRCGFYRPSLMSLLYNDYKQVVQELQPAASQLSSILLKTDERVFVDFGIDWFRLQFLCHKDSVFKQREILERIILLMGDNDHVAKNALSFLCKMVTEGEERQCLASHCNHLRILLEKMDNLGLEEVGTLNDLLHNLCMNSSSISGSLRDDLFILLQKQLSNFKPLTKCKGVLGAVMAIKHLMKKTETSASAYNLFKSVLTNVKNCQRSQALFYDQLSRIIAQTNDIDAEFMQKLTNYIEEEFVNTHMIEKPNYKGELVPKFGLNDAEDEPQNCVLNFENKKYGAIVPISFKLLRTCCIKLSEDGDLDAIDSLLGCAVLMPEHFDIADHSVVDLVICCINWFREVISGFVMQTDPLLRKQVLQRLDNLIYLQGELSKLMALCDTKYQPPPCYFHHFPIPPFIRSEKKVGKKGRKKKKTSPEKSMNITETESWELGCAICSKNPTYFRKLDASIAHLLDIRMELHASQPASYNISLKQVCFVAKELLGLFEHESNETFIRDLIQLLPKICSKLQDIVEALREDGDNENREAARLLLCLLTKIFNWKGFESVTYNALLREGLRTLAGQINECNGMLRSCKELVAESYKYFESLSDIATQIPLAIALINMCQSLMKHSESYTKEYKEKHAKIAFSFLCLEWPEDKHFTAQYKAAVIGLLNNWIDNEPLPLKTVTSVLEWLPDEAAKLETPQDCLGRIPSVRRNNFHALFKKIFDGLIKGVKIALSLVDRDPKRIDVWQEVAVDVQKLVQICKTLRTKYNISIFLRYMPILLRHFLSTGMPILEHNLKYQTEDVTRILKLLQGGTRFLHTICCESAEKKDITLTKHVPAAKSVLERLIYSVKGMLVLNNSPAAFWMGNLVNKNLDGDVILSQNLSSEEGSVLRTEDVTDDLTHDGSLDLLDSDSNDDPIEENDD